MKYCEILAKIAGEVIFMSYSKYKNARDIAWEILLECGVNTLPVRLSIICDHYGWTLTDYQTGAPSLALLGLEGLTKRTDGFCAVTKNHTYIFFNSTLPTGRQRFTIAHEIGHLVLGHVGRGNVTTVNREPSPKDSPTERQANQFAARLLAPACVLHELGAVTPETIQQACGLSRQAANFRAARMQELERRNRYYVSPLERLVLQQFASHIARVLGR